MRCHWADGFFNFRQSTFFLSLEKLQTKKLFLALRSNSLSLSLCLSTEKILCDIFFGLGILELWSLPRLRWSFFEVLDRGGARGRGSRIGELKRSLSLSLFLSLTGSDWPWRCRACEAFVFISDIRNCQNKEQERLRVDKELGNVRTRFKNEKVSLLG